MLIILHKPTIYLVELLVLFLTDSAVTIIDKAVSTFKKWLHVDYFFTFLPQFLELESEFMPFRFTFTVAFPTRSEKNEWLKIQV